MCENSPAGVRVVGFADFTRGRPSRIANPDASPDVRALAVQRAMSRVGERRQSERRQSERRQSERRQSKRRQSKMLASMPFVTLG
jgi:hypothetical protein